MKSALLFMLISLQAFAQWNPKEIHTYLALGDSYTIGESVAESERYPSQLVRDLTKSGFEITTLKIIARTGWTTDELKTAMTTEQIMEKKFDMVSLLIGVNNQYRGRDPEIYRKEFVGLLRDAITLAHGDHKKVFVVSIPDWGVTPFGLKSTKPAISKNIDLFNKINKEESKKLGVLYVDITPISRKAKKDLSLIATDGLHPSGKMYSAWVEKIMKQMKIKKA